VQAEPLEQVWLVAEIAVAAEPSAAVEKVVPAQGRQDCDSELGQLERRLEARDRSPQVQDRWRVVEKPAELH
jgi:hypothetical protein